MKKLEAIKKFGANTCGVDLHTVKGGRQIGTSAGPNSTAMSDPKCSDSEVWYDDDNGNITGKCTTINCP